MVLLNTSISGDEGESLTICLSLTNGILLYPLEVNVSGSSKFYSLFIEYLNLRKMCEGLILQICKRDLAANKQSLER